MRASSCRSSAISITTGICSSPKYPDCARDLAKYRINPGNVGSKRRDENFRTIVQIAVEHQKPVRIGVNWGSLDQDLLTQMMDENARLSVPRDAKTVYIEAMLARARSARRSSPESTGLRHDQIIISAKVSGVQDLVDVYRKLAARCDYPLHLGLTEAGMGTKGVVASTAGLSILLAEGIGDTIRVSLTPKPNGDRTEEVLVAQQILAVARAPEFRAAGDGVPRLRSHDVDVLPAHGARHSDVHSRADAGVARTAPGRGGDEGRRDGLRREWTRRIKAREHRNLAARHVRGSESPCLCRRRVADDAARRFHRSGFSKDSRGLRGVALRRGGEPHHLSRRRGDRATLCAVRRGRVAPLLERHDDGSELRA